MLALKHHMRDLMQDRGRVIVTILGVVWGTMAVTTLVVFLEGISHTILRAEQGLGKGLVVIRAGATSLPHEGVPAGRYIPLFSRDAEFLAHAVPEVGELSREYVRNGTSLAYSGRNYTTDVSGVEPAYGQIRNCLPQPGGRFINDLDMHHRRRVVFLGDEVKAEVFGPADPVGQTILIRGVPFAVIGVMQSKLQWSSYQGQDKERVFIPATTFEAIWGTQRVSAIVYRSPPGPQAAIVEQEARSALARRLHFDENDQFALNIWNTRIGEKITLDIHHGVRFCMGIIGVVTLIVAGVGVGNVMYVLVKGRTREIGIKVAVGARPSDITLYHLIEGFVIVLAGGAAGLLASWLLMIGMHQIPLEEEAWLYFGRPQMSLWSVALVAVVLGLVGLFAGFFPARRAAMIDPVEALRYE
jgi:putative ABC transport system permease protein